jgi:trans-L-3-hydroxyproline dehydratase
MSGSNSSSSYWLETEDWHTAGEPFRIVEHIPKGYLPDAASVTERRAIVLNTVSHPLDTLRRTLCHEPRGHADMYGGFITPPNDSGAHFGVLFWHKDSFSTACGHGTIALGFWAVCKGLVKMPEEDGTVDVIVDVPSGRVRARVLVKNGKPTHADFVNVQSHQLTDLLSISVQSLKVDALVRISYGGAPIAFVDAKQFSLAIEPINAQKLINLGREIKASVSRDHPNLYSQYDGPTGVVFYEDESQESDKMEGVIRERNVNIYGDGQIDRSPCGSGTCARLAIHFSDRRIGVGNGKLVNRSIIGTIFEGSILSEEEGSSDGYPACIPMVRGAANLVGRMSFFIDPQDPVYPGFLLQ